jgi:hypothetical protein
MKKNNYSFWQWLYKSHRYIGLVSALVLLMLALTGITLNHTEDLKLDSRFVQNKILLNWYGIFAPNPKRVFKTPSHYLSQFDNQIFLDQQRILNSVDLLQGAVETKKIIAIALTHSILLVSIEGELIEQIERLNLEHIGINEQQHVFIKQSGRVFISDDGLLTWKATDTEKIQWSQLVQLPTAIENNIKQKYRSHILSLERIFLDLHSGRIFGNIGVIMVDLCGVLLILLVLSGVRIFLKSHFRK